jgi:pimeloyl-ACP methyl ester carboxylesterase
VASRGVQLAGRDFGGSGGAITLLHGLGRSLVDWQLIAPLLSVEHDVVAFDQRCQGHSDDGAWSWEKALADIAAVADHLQFANPAIAGHSLGGMLAVIWGESHPNCPGVVNLDGHGRKRLDQYVGLDPGDANQRQEQLLAQQQALAARIGVPV